MRVFVTEEFSKEAQKVFSSDQREQLQTFINKLRQRQQRGKILGPRYLREVRIQSKRAYYICNKTAAVFVAASVKKKQKDYIRKIQRRSSEYLELLDTLTAQ